MTLSDSISIRVSIYNYNNARSAISALVDFELDALGSAVANATFMQNNLHFPTTSRSK